MFVQLPATLNQTNAALGQVARQTVEKSGSTRTYEIVQIQSPIRMYNAQSPFRISSYYACILYRYFVTAK